MSMSTSGFIMAAMLVIVLPGSASLADEAPAYELISDPEALEERGFDPLGPPIRRLVVPEDRRPLDARIEKREQIESLRAPAEHRGYGVNWVSVQATDFQFLNEEAIYTTRGLHELSCRPGSPNRFADAPVHVANNRRLQFFDVWTRDTSDLYRVDVALYETCQPLSSGGAPVVTEMGTVQGSNAGTPGDDFSFVSLPAVFPQNSICGYFVRARFSSCQGDTSVAVYKARVIWEQ